MISARRTRSILPATVVAVGLAGCGLLPAQPAATATSASGSAGGNELPTPAGPPERVLAGGRSPVAAVRRFALTYVNWDAADVAARLRSLARDSVGQARSELQLEAEQTRNDRALHRGGVGNSGVVEAVARLPGARLRYVVITRERTTASGTAAYAGLPPAWHVTLATVARVPVRGVSRRWRWAVSGWQPQS